MPSVKPDRQSWSVCFLSCSAFLIRFPPPVPGSHLWLILGMAGHTEIDQNLSTDADDEHGIRAARAGVLGGSDSNGTTTTGRREAQIKSLLIWPTQSVRWRRSPAHSLPIISRPFTANHVARNSVTVLVWEQIYLSLIAHIIAHQFAGCGELVER